MAFSVVKLQKNKNVTLPRPISGRRSGRKGSGRLMKRGGEER